MPQTVVTRFTATAGSAAAIPDLVEPVLEAAHDQAGCLAAALHRAADDPRSFWVVERWTSGVAREALQLQPGTPTLDGLVGEHLEAAPEVTVLDPIAVGDPVKGAL